MNLKRSRLVGLGSSIGPMVFLMTTRPMVAAEAAVGVVGESNESI